ncbi:MAG: glycosyltransferase family 4 protein [Bacteroidales bacterium]|nr:glycosyltransferase family 4 protein [Bacteroidales bacterium]
MKKTNLYLLNITNVNATSGVDRYIDALLNEIKFHTEDIRVYKIELMRNPSLLFAEQTEKEGYTEIVVPFPLDCGEIIHERYWIRKYNTYVFEQLKWIFDKNAISVLHIHYLNLIDLALYIKEQVPCKIITHLHCIPWKSSFNTHKKKFNTLYTESYLNTNKTLGKDFFLTNNCEYDAYSASDKVVTVTGCAKQFLVQTMEIDPGKIAVIPNGLYDCNKGSPAARRQKNKREVFNCLYVGVLSKSKGIFYILEALRKVQLRNYKVILNVAGACSPEFKKKIETDFSDLSVNLLGRIPFEDLKKQYSENDIGIIASIQEQCSYVAIEMAMFGLPVVTTAVDGLDEMFEDTVNALKVNTVFSKVFGLKVDTDSLAEKIIQLIENEELRRKLGKNARKLYEEKFTSGRMMREMMEVYEECTNY